MNGTAWLESMHGHLGVLACAALAHPAIRMRKGAPLSSGARWSIGLTTLGVVGAFATGLVIYARYVAEVRPFVFRASAQAGLLFETKEHLAFLVVGTSLGACACALLAPREARSLRRLASLLYALGALACLGTVLLGTHVASVATFAR
ncbi:MAG: hypothetical protein HY908_15880 [Myxococcales bacterium]|nr:hypothetical protein [Myxococcales bacterium]